MDEDNGFQLQRTDELRMGEVHGCGCVGEGERGEREEKRGKERGEREKLKQQERWMKMIYVFLMLFYFIIYFEECMATGVSRFISQRLHLNTSYFGVNIPVRQYLLIIV